MNQDKLGATEQDVVNVEWSKNFRAFSQEQRNKLHALRRAERRLIRRATGSKVDTGPRREMLEDAKLLSKEAEAVELMLNVFADKR